MNAPGPDGAAITRTLVERLGRRTFLRAVSAVGITGGAMAVGAVPALAGDRDGRRGGDRDGRRGDRGHHDRDRSCAPDDFPVLQPGAGAIHGDHYLASDPTLVRWGYVPTVHAEPVLTMASGQTVTIDTVSHEGILEDQGRDPVTFFGQHGMDRSRVLDDAVAVAAEYDRHPRNFDLDGPHVVTGPVFVEGAEPGDVLKIEPLEAVPRVPYGVVSSRHGKGSLPRLSDGSAPAGITLEEVMPPIETDGRPTGVPTQYGNVSVFTAIDDDDGVMPFGDDRTVRFPLRPFMGMMGVAFADATELTSPTANSIPPTLGGGNIDIRLLGVGSTFYLPVFAPGALFYVGDPHMSMGDGEVALTAMEGSLRGTFRLTVCKPGSGDAPSVAHRYPFAETENAWIPIGLSDPDGAVDGQNSDLDVAMRRAVLNALDFLQEEQGMDRATAYAYLSAAADFVISQVVDRTVGVHGLIAKNHFA
ncbi:acetamidase/formamidase family protein [Nakamurella leprariae]|uniref:Acetamidase/formamidase family protein n=1 Tax=Nakamurella leprariae TaxID=2803911 RepID=A0A938YCZ2_9ACTN|nr:acetamidase/formamidase family protein [Nakamurella leprariae]MBM9468392.1 acetamidase/formamidase family protein [Nakamurella leprariae]